MGTRGSDPLPSAEDYAECPGCRALNLPGTAACENCGTPVPGDGPVGVSPAPSGACPACGRIQRDGAQFCEECGAPLDARAAAVRAARGRGRAAGELSGAIRVVRYARGITAFCAVVSAILAIVVWWLGTREDGPGPGDPEVLLPLLIYVAQTALMAVAWWRLFRDPFFWTILVAAFVTLNAAFTFLAGGIPVLLIIWALFLWSGVPATSRAKELIAQYPDLRTARAFSGASGAPARPEAPLRRASPQGTIAVGETTRRARERAARGAREGRKRYALFGAIAGMLLLFGGAAYFVAGPARPAAAPPHEEFVTALEAGDAAAMRTLFPPDLAERMGSGWDAMARRRGWDTTPPHVVEVRMGRTTARSAVVYVHVAGSDDPIFTLWSLRDGRWVLAGLRPPKS